MLQSEGDEPTYFTSIILKNVKIPREITLLTTAPPPPKKKKPDTALSYGRFQAFARFFVN
jgi:hypothetical protein